MELLTSPRYRDFVGGLLLILIGLSAAFQGRSYQVGTIDNMGAGFFPVALGIILALTGGILLGGAIARRIRLQAVPDSEQAAPALPFEWRGWICICLSVIAFAVLSDYTGLVPATFACVAIAGIADRENSLREILLLATGITLAGAAVFWWGLGVTIPLFMRGYM
jgi:Tripartite tricarboxylate transporter TctB family